MGDLDLELSSTWAHLGETIIVTESITDPTATSYWTSMAIPVYTDTCGFYSTQNGNFNSISLREENDLFPVYLSDIDGSNFTPYVDVATLIAYDLS